MKIYIIQIVNYTLSFLMWMILGRMLLALIVGNRKNILTGLFEKITEPVFKVMRKMLPFANERHIPWLSILLIVIIRIAIIIISQPAANR